MPLEYATKAGVKLRLGIPTEDESSDPIIDKVRGHVNSWIEGPGGIGAPIGPSPLEELTLDGRDALDNGTTMFVRIGVREVTSLTVGGREVELDRVRLRPLEQDREGGFPAQYVLLGSGSFGYGYPFGSDFEDVVIGGSFGLEEIPSDIVEIAEVTTVRGVLSVQAGETDLTGTPQLGQPMVSRWVAGRDRDTIRGYRKKLSLNKGLTSMWTG